MYHINKKKRKEGRKKERKAKKRKKNRKKNIKKKGMENRREWKIGGKEK
jgi:hypothetical protein